jgi:poly-gamma-glutamate synthesis protein (capsule biosynthesis protein)
MRKYIIAPLIGALTLLIIMQDKQPNSTLTISFLGDTMLGRLVNEHIHQTSYEYPWGNVLEDLNAKDLVIANLETTLTNASEPVPKVFNFKANPDIVETLKRGNINVVNLANNHSLDFGIEGPRETIITLDKAHIQHVGAGMNRHEAQKPVILEKNGIRIGIIGLTDNEPDWLAQDNKPGTNYIDISNSNIPLFESISQLKKEVDIVIVTIHWGPNMREYPSASFIEFAHKLIDAGVDIFHGHSAHVIQGIEIYKNKIIMYDTGDFVDDYAVDPVLRNDLSFLFSVEIENRQVKQLILTPTKIAHMQVNHAVDEDAQAAIELIKKRSEPFGTVFNRINNALVVDIS